MVVNIVEPNQVSEVISYQGDWTLEVYAILKKLSIRTLFRIKLRLSRSRELITCHNIIKIIQLALGELDKFYILLYNNHYYCYASYNWFV